MAHRSVYAFYAVNDTKNTKYVKATCHCMQQLPLYATNAIVAKYRNLRVIQPNHHCQLICTFC